MRITQGIMTRNFLNAMQRNASLLTESDNKIFDMRSFTRMSQNVTGGARAYRIRQQLYINRQLQRNVENIQEEFNVAEGHMKKTATILKTGHDDAIKIQNGIYAEMEHETVAEQYETNMAEILANMNAVYGDHYVFSGTKNDEKPFTLNNYNELLYNTVPVADIAREVQFAEFYVDTDGKQYAGSWNDDRTEFSYTGPNGKQYIVCNYSTYPPGSPNVGPLPTGLYPSGSPNAGTHIADSDGRYYDPRLDQSATLTPPQQHDGTIYKLPIAAGFSYAKINDFVKATDVDPTLPATNNDYYKIIRQADGNYHCFDGAGNPVLDANGKNIAVDPNVLRGMTTYASDDGTTTGVMSHGDYFRDNASGYYYRINDDDPTKYTDQFGEKHAIPANVSWYDVEHVPYSENKYIDTGIGLNFDDLHGLDRNTVIQSNVSGLDAFGFGVKDVTYITLDGVEKHYQVPNNVYQVYGELAKTLRAGDMDQFAALDIQLVSKRDDLVKHWSNLGVRGSYMAATLDRLGSEELTLWHLQQSVEAIDLPTEATKNKMLAYGWQATLQFGSSFLPLSLMDFLR